MEKSPAKYDVDSSKFSCDSPSDVFLGELADLAIFQRVAVRVKVDGESDPVQVKNLMKEEYISDSTGSSMIVAWEDNVGIL